MSLRQSVQAFAAGQYGEILFFRALHQLLRRLLIDDAHCEQPEFLIHAALKKGQAHLSASDQDHQSGYGTSQRSRVLQVQFLSIGTSDDAVVS
ncbi:hypothetical protein ABIE45_006178 [Methylobacterium sp. OAE515]